MLNARLLTPGAERRGANILNIAMEKVYAVPPRLSPLASHLTCPTTSHLALTSHLTPYLPLCSRA